MLIELWSSSYEVAHLTVQIHIHTYNSIPTHFFVNISINDFA